MAGDITVAVVDMFPSRPSCRSFPIMEGGVPRPRLFTIIRVAIVRITTITVHITGTGLIAPIAGIASITAGRIILTLPRRVTGIIIRAAGQGFTSIIATTARFTGKGTEGALDRHRARDEGMKNFIPFFVENFASQKSGVQACLYGLSFSPTIIMGYEQIRGR